MRFATAVTAIVFVTSGAYAQAPSQLGTVIGDLRVALDRGHGQLCSLDLMPVIEGGYYPCVDIGPYRFVAEYGRTRGLVIIDGQPPFDILLSDGAGTRFQYQGPWTTNLQPMVANWLVEVTGAGEKSAPSVDPSLAGQAVEAYMQSLEPPAEEPAPPPTPAAAPQVIYIVPPNYQPAVPPVVPPTVPTGQIPLTGVPSMTTPGGVTLAPGVVGYPAGLPQQ